jgi:hypothetical protein
MRIPGGHICTLSRLASANLERCGRDMRPKVVRKTRRLMHTKCSQHEKRGYRSRVSQGLGSQLASGRHNGQRQSLSIVFQLLEMFQDRIVGATAFLLVRVMAYTPHTSPGSTESRRVTNISRALFVSGRSEVKVWQ